MLATKDFVKLSRLIGENKARNMLSLMIPVFGIFHDDELISVAGTLVRLNDVWMIGGVYTHPKFRNRGYATSVVSYWVMEAFKHTRNACLWVRSDNIPAIRLYNKIGFKFKRKQAWINTYEDIKP